MTRQIKGIKFGYLKSQAKSCRLKNDVSSCLWCKFLFNENCPFFKLVNKDSYIMFKLDEPSWKYKSYDSWEEMRINLLIKKWKSGELNNNV